VKFLHTSDWHVGKAIRGRSRADEHTAVLAEVAAIADAQAVDLVLVVGDLFDAAAPPPEAERIVYDALLRLSAGGSRPVVVVAGNHDSAARLHAVAPVFAAHGVRILDRPSAPADGGVVEVPTAGGLARLALLPFPSQRGVVTAEALMSQEAADHGQTYADRVRIILGALAQGFTDDAVNIVCAHLMVMGGTIGGGERGAHTIFDYWVPATAFPTTAHYAALGHLHRAQQLAGPCPLHYCGSPLQLDFGETANAPQVNVVTATAGRAGVAVEAVALAAGRRLRVVRGTPEELEVAAVASDFGDDHLKLVVDTSPIPGLADSLRQRFPNAVEVVLAQRDVEQRRGHDEVEARIGRSPQDLFGAYLAEVGADDPAVRALFAELVDEVAST
jgi:exonuclease SbcD